MAEKRPLVQSSGALEEIATADTVARSALGTGAPGAGNFLRGDGTWATPPGGGTRAVGKTTVDFGAVPGSLDAQTVITGQAGILVGSVVSAWLLAEATADNSADEHVVERISITAGAIVAATGFTIFANADGPLTGLWSVAWSWE